MLSTDEQRLADQSVKESFERMTDFGLEKKLLENGSKARQNDSTEDRALIYKDFLRTIPTNGFFLDVDFLKFRYVDGEIKPVAITELTRCDYETVNQNYLNAIHERVFIRDLQGKTISIIANLLNVPAYLVLFQKDLLWFYVWSFRKQIWKYFTKEEYIKWITQL